MGVSEEGKVGTSSDVTVVRVASEHMNWSEGHGSEEPR